MADKNHVESIFAESLKVPPAERPSFLDRRCGHDGDLRRQVESLLDANQAMGNFLDQTQSRVDENERVESSSSSNSSIHGRFLPGTVIDRRYRIVSLVGRGGMGEVYRADDLKLGQTVALKFLPVDFAKDEKRLDYFHQEVRLTRQISHPNVCRVYDIGEVDGQHFLSMEYIDGEDLRVLLRRIGRVPPDKGIEIAQQMCAGLAAAHEKNVLHRDLKPANIMIDGRGQVRITDFGLAKVLDDGVKGEVAGTPAYMAPEQLLSGETSERSDLYSFGLIFAEMFLGEPVNTSGSVTDLISHHQSSDSALETLSSVDVDPAVERAVLACLRKSPEDRPSSARQLAHALPGGDPLEAAIAAGTTPSPELVVNAPEQERLPILLAVGWLGLVVIGIGIALMNGRRTKRMLETSPAILSARCAEIVESLGYSNLPNNTLFGAHQNVKMQEQLTRLDAGDREAWLADHPEPKYHFWQRWTDGMFKVEEYHAAFASSVEGPIVDGDSEVTVSVDEHGNLLHLNVVGIDTTDQSDEWKQVNWAEVLALADLDVGDVSETALASDPSAYCTEYIAWEVGNGKQRRMIQAGTLRGKCNYFEVVGLRDAMKPDTEQSNVINVTLTVVKLFIALIAWMNVRAGRANWMGAIRASAFIFGLYVVQEVLSIRFHSPHAVEFLFGLVEDRALGHMLGHAFTICIVYLGIEPYVRRLWPKSLVGLSRILDCRWTDQRVGSELLLGVGVGCLAFVAGALSKTAFESDGIELVWLVRVATTPAQWLAGMTNQLSSMFLIVFALAAMCALVRVVARRFKFEVAIFLIAATFGILLSISRPESVPWYAPLFFFFVFLMNAILFTRVGMLAALAAIYTIVTLASGLPMNFQSWYAGYAIASLSILASLPSLDSLLRAEASWNF